MLVFWVGVCALVLACSLEEDESKPSPLSSEEQLMFVIPDKFQQGEELFNRSCAVCHGVYAVGTRTGPPLVHKIYERSHHSDFAFLRAAEQGVRAHHWQFGNMPKISDVTQADIQAIVLYVRWLQRKAGID